MGATLTLSTTTGQVQLFESEQGCALVRQFLEVSLFPLVQIVAPALVLFLSFILLFILKKQLAQVVAVSTPATSPTAHMQAMITQKYVEKFSTSTLWSFLFLILSRSFLESFFLFKIRCFMHYLVRLREKMGL